MRTLVWTHSLVCLLGCTPTRGQPGVQVGAPLALDSSPAAVPDADATLPTWTKHPLALTHACGWDGAWQTTYDLPEVRALAQDPDGGVTALTATALLHLDAQGAPHGVRSLADRLTDAAAMARLPGAWAVLDGATSRMVLVPDQGVVQPMAVPVHPGDVLRAITGVGEADLAVGGVQAGDPATNSDDVARVARLDAQGHTVWDQTYPPAIAVESMVAMSDGGLAVLGRSPPAALPQAWLARLDPQGLPMWTWIASAHASGQFLGVRADGSLLAAIDATVGYQGQCSALLAAVSGAGETLWTRCVAERAGPLLVVPRATVEGAGAASVALLVGTAKHASELVLDATDPLGLPLWSATVTDWGVDTDVQGQTQEHGQDVQPRALLALPEGGLLVGGSVAGHAWLAGLAPGQGCPPP